MLRHRGASSLLPSTFPRSRFTVHHQQNKKNEIILFTYIFLSIFLYFFHYFHYHSLLLLLLFLLLFLLLLLVLLLLFLLLLLLLLDSLFTFILFPQKQFILYFPQGRPGHDPHLHYYSKSFISFSIPHSFLIYILYIFQRRETGSQPAIPLLPQFKNPNQLQFSYLIIPALFTYILELEHIYIFFDGYHYTIPCLYFQLLNNLSQTPRTYRRFSN